MMRTAAALQPPELDPMTLETPDGYELINGARREKSMSRESSWIATQVASLLWVHCRETGIGEAFGADTAYRCFAGRPRHSRKPDASFVSRKRLPKVPSGPGDFLLPPDLVVEVISPNEPASALNSEVEDFRAVGVPLIWVIDPENRLATIYSTDSIRIVGEQDELSGGDVLPGFRMKLADVLLPPTPAATPESP